MFYSIYHSFSGIMSIVLGLLTIGGGVFYLVNGSKTGIIFLIMAVLFFVLQPAMIMIESNMQMKNVVFQNKTYYEFGEEAMQAWQDGVNPGTIKWEKIHKVVKNGAHFYIYFDKVRANVVPRSSFVEADGAEQFEKLILKVLDAKKRKGFKA